MTEYRHKTSGDIKTRNELIAANKNMSIPKVWTDSVLEALNVDPVLIVAAPTDGVGAYQQAVRNGVEQDSDGNWQQAWQISNMFADIEGGQTKSEQETAYQAGLDSAAAKNNRTKRDWFLEKTDWWAVSDRTMTSAQTTYRQALRDITAHSNWPHLKDADWPTEP